MSDAIQKVLARMRGWAEQYHEFGRQAKAIEEKRAKIRENCLKVFDALSRDEQGFPRSDGTVLKVQRYSLNKVDWDIKAAIRVLREKKLERCIKLVIDESALKDALEKGLISLE